jgi:periplasmic divalent cation tolerance protein
MEQILLILTNVPDETTAHFLARRLVECRLAACVNLLPAVRSIYQWQGSIEETTEIPILIKTVQTRYAELEAEIKANHPYEVPEIIALPITAGLPGYFDWVVSETKKDLDA